MSISITSALAELNNSLDNLKSSGSIPVSTGNVVAVAKRRGRPPGSKNKKERSNVVPMSPGRPPASPMDPRLTDPAFIDDIRGMVKKWRCKNTKQFLTLARQATQTRMKFEMTDEKRNRMFALFADGKFPRYVAEKMGCSVAHANNVKVEWLKGQRKVS